MRLYLYLLFGSLSLASSAAPFMEAKPADAYFQNFRLLRAPSSFQLSLKPGDRLAICGDSITEQAKYSRLMEDYLTMCTPQLRIAVRQYGWAGERVPGFLARMTNDCLRFKPTIATTCYGMNDSTYHPYNDEIGKIYEDSSRAMIKAFKAHGVRVILGSPGNVSKMPYWGTPSGTVDELNVNLCELRNIDVKLAEQENVPFADVFWPMLKGNYYGHERYGKNYAIPGDDGVHPLWAGHAIMSYAFLRALGLDGNIGTFTVDMRSGKATVSAGHSLDSAKAGEYTITSSRYPFCPPDQEPVDSDNSIRSGMTLVPFNDELNRLMLVIKNGKAARYHVTWQGESKTFSREQLKRGVNLAAEFPSNPFAAAFARVDAAIAAKQAFETKEVKYDFHHTDEKNPTIEQVVAHTDQIFDKEEATHSRLAAAVQSAFVPVTHTIQITAE